MPELEDQYVDEILRLFARIGSKFPLIDRDSLQFLFWFMWINFEWEPADSSEPPEGVLALLCDNANDQSVDGFYFDDENQVVTLIQSKYTRDWSSPVRITFNELKKTTDVLSYLESGDENAVVFKMANEACKKLLTKAFDKVKRRDYDYRVVLASNKLEPSDANLNKLKEVVGTDIVEEKFEILARPRLFQLWAQFLEGHNPLIPQTFVETIDERYLKLETPKRNLEAYVAVTNAKIVSKLYRKYRERIFDKNVRSFLGKISVNVEISETLDRDPELFFYRNSGLTILSSRVDPVPAKHGAHPGFWITDLQIINGQQTTRKIAENPKSEAAVLLTIIGPHKESNSDEKLYDVRRREMITTIIAARNWQSKVGYADLKANDPIQVKIARVLRDKGYYYERKKRAWVNLNQYQRTIYRLASRYSWAVIKKERLAAVVLATIDDPQRPFEGSDFIFKDKYKTVFPQKRLNVDYLLALHLVSKRYAYDLSEEGESYAQYHVLRFLVDRLPLTKTNAKQVVKLLEARKLDPNLKRATRILYKLCNEVLVKAQAKSRTHLSLNTMFGKRTGLLAEMKRVFRSAAFKKDRKKFGDAMVRLRRAVQAMSD